MGQPIPGGRITQVFGRTNEKLDSGGTNKGIDVSAVVGTTVLAVVSGTVVSVGDVGDGWGFSIKIQDSQGNIHNYGHMQGSTLQQGSQVQAGQDIGQSGNTGKSRAPHLSYDVKDGTGQYIDPSVFLGAAPGTFVGDNRSITNYESFTEQYNGLGGNRETIEQIPETGFSPANTGTPSADSGTATQDIPTSYEEWLAEYKDPFFEFRQLDNRLAAIDIMGEGLVIKIPGRGFVTGYTADYLGAINLESGNVLMSEADILRWAELSEENAAREEVFEAKFGPQALDQVLRRSEFLYNTDPRVVDAQNAADEFTRDFNVAREATDQAKALLDSQNINQREAIAETNLVQQSPKLGLVARAPTMFPTSFDDFYDRSVSRIEEGLPEFSPLPYNDNRTIPDFRVLGEIQQDIIDARGVLAPTGVPTGVRGGGGGPFDARGGGRVLGGPTGVRGGGGPRPEPHRPPLTFANTGIPVAADGNAEFGRVELEDINRTVRAGGRFTGRAAQSAFSGVRRLAGSIFR